MSAAAKSEPRYAGYAMDPWLALAEAQTNAVDMLAYQRSRIMMLDFDVRFKP